MSRNIIIAGGGIGGMTAALALHQSGIEAAIYERAPAFAEIGAGMSLWPNATRVLASLGVLDEVVARGETFTQFDLRRSDGRAISEISMEGFATPSLCLHRADLQQVLHRALRAVPLEPGRSVQSFDQDPDGVTVRFADGRAARADGLVGADGIHSAIRAQLHGPGRPVYRGYCIWRGIAPDTGLAVRGHISETWGAGLRFGILPMGAGKICWYATRNGPPAQPDAPEGRQQEIYDLFRDWHHPIPELIAATRAADIIKGNAQDRKSLRRWGDGRVTLLGDAAHPITPNVGQGAGLAIEDAACLAKLLRDGGDVAAAFRAYEGSRRGRTATIARQSRRIGAIGQWENRWLVPARNLVARLVLTRSPNVQLNTMYAYQV
jgi:2-polyprenyl-6-methoxyphenol hydroxylase-like FAD-dependent oxidoreductase